MKLIDTHAHLDHLKDLEGALTRARDSGIESIVAVSEDLASSRKNLSISQTFREPRIYLALGMHPSEANAQDLVGLSDLIDENRDSLLAIGEVGLDFWYKWVRKDDEKKQEQKEVFSFFLQKAKDCQLPVIIHSRGAWRECLDMVKEKGNTKVLFHWYSGPLKILDEILASGFFISATPSLFYSPEAQAAVKAAPTDRILLETDTPVYYRNRKTDEGFSAEPKDVFKTLDYFCDLMQREKEEVAEQLNANAKNFFNIE